MPAGSVHIKNCDDVHGICCQFDKRASVGGSDCVGCMFTAVLELL